MNLKDYFSSTYSSKINETVESEDENEDEDINEISAESGSEFENVKNRSVKRMKHTHQALGGRASKFQADYSITYAADTIQKGKTDCQFFCRACGNDYSLGKNSDKNIKSHIDTNKHKTNLKTYNENRPYTDYAKAKV
jgi:hypothetical protein